MTADNPIEIPERVWDAYEAVVAAADAALTALAHRWTVVDCTPDEERTIRELNDAVQALYAAKG